MRTVLCFVWNAVCLESHLKNPPAREIDKHLSSLLITVDKVENIYYYLVRFFCYEAVKYRGYEIRPSLEKLNFLQMLKDMPFF